MKNIFAAFLVMMLLAVCGFELVQNSMLSIGENFGFVDSNIDQEDENNTDDVKPFKEYLIQMVSSFSSESFFSQKHLATLRLELPKHPDQWIFSPPPNSVEH